MKTIKHNLSVFQVGTYSYNIKALKGMSFETFYETLKKHSEEILFFYGSFKECYKKVTGNDLTEKTNSNEISEKFIPKKDKKNRNKNNVL